MNKAELVESIAKDTNMTKKDVDLVISSMIKVMTNTLAMQDKITIRGFGTFEVKERTSRQAYNPQTKDLIVVPGKNMPTFKPSLDLKKAVNKRNF